MTVSDDGSPRGVTRLTRSTALRRVATTLGVGLGIALVPAGSASAQGGHCCPDTTCPTCSSGHRFRCFSGGTNCCCCIKNHSGCFNIADPCPCP
jgi:hypothetical protein